jgi:predicted phage tail protein
MNAGSVLAAFFQAALTGWVMFLAEWGCSLAERLLGAAAVFGLSLMLGGVCHFVAREFRPTTREEVERLVRHNMGEPPARR